MPYLIYIFTINKREAPHKEEKDKSKGKSGAKPSEAHSVINSHKGSKFEKDLNEQDDILDELNNNVIYL